MTFYVHAYVCIVQLVIYVRNFDISILIKFVKKKKQSGRMLFARRRRRMNDRKFQSFFREFFTVWSTVQTREAANRAKRSGAQGIIVIEIHRDSQKQLVPRCAQNIFHRENRSYRMKYDFWNVVTVLVKDVPQRSVAPINGTLVVRFDLIKEILSLR